MDRFFWRAVGRVVVIVGGIALVIAYASTAVSAIYHGGWSEVAGWVMVGVGTAAMVGFFAAGMAELDRIREDADRRKAERENEHACDE